MAEQTIQCPNCGQEFALDAAFKEHFEAEKRQAVSDAVKTARQKAEEERERLKEQFAEERSELEKQADETAEKKFRLDLEAKDEEMRRVQKKLEELERRTRQGSMELQGEALETHLKATLQGTFPLDTIEDVKKGQSGADLLHTVINPRGQRCGTIVWEAKNTKNWNGNWLDKIKDDATSVNAQLMVIVSVALPDEVSTF